MEYFVNYYNNDFERIKHDSKIERIMIENNEPLRTKLQQLSKKYCNLIEQKSIICQ